MSKILLELGLAVLLVFISGVYAMAQTCIQPPAGLVAWWPGDGNANDIIGGNDGTLQNGATFVSGKVGQAFSFDGVDDHISGSTVAGFPLGVSPRTITAWIKSTSTSTLDRNIFHYGVSNANLPPTNFHLFIRGATGRIGVGNGFDFGTVDGTTFVDDGNFHFVVGVYEGPGTNIARIYVDGVQEASAVITTPGTLSGAWRIGQFLDPGPGAGFQGLIDEVDIYNVALSAAEIQAIFEAGSAGKCKLAPPDQCQLQLDQCQQDLTAAEQEIQSLENQVGALTAQNAQLQQTVQDLQYQLTQFTTAVGSGLASIQNDFRVVFHNPTFVVPGATLVEQYQNLATAILNLNQGRKMGIYTNLGGKP